MTTSGRTIAVWSDRRGGIAILFGLLAVPLVACVGLAIDYTRSNRIATDAQLSLDAAALAAARAKSLSQGDPKVVAEQYFQSNFIAKNDTIKYKVLTTLNEGSRNITVRAAADMKTYFARIMGIDSFKLDLEAQATYGLMASELVLVLDNTGSMEGTKLEALKTAATGLVDTIYSVPNAEANVRVGIVPFAQYVNVGMEYRAASWMDVPMDSSTTQYQCWNTYPNAVSSNCQTTTSSCLKDGMPSSCTTTTCDWNYGDPVETCGDVTSTKTWYGCVGSRAYPAEVGTSSDFSTRVPGIMNASCNSPLSRLTNSRTDLVDKIQAMTASQETFIQPGVIWGWRVLDWNGPFADGLDPSATEVRKYMVVMTDGINTKSPAYPEHWNTDAALSNQLTAETCASVKAKGVVIFTVAFEVTDPAVVEVLKACATEPSNYYEAADSGGLADSFKKIAESLSMIRISK